MKKLKITDDFGKKYTTENLKNFKEHILKHHTINGKPDNSLHIENGMSFTVTKNFFITLWKIKKSLLKEIS